MSLSRRNLVRAAFFVVFVISLINFPLYTQAETSSCAPLSEVSSIQLKDKESSYSYDADNQLKAVVNHKNGTLNWTKNIFDSNGNLIKKVYKSAQGNYLANPSFEKGIEDWVINNGNDGASAIDTASAINGKQSLKVTRASAGDQFQYEGHNFGTYIGGRTFTLSAFVKTWGITGKGVHLRLYWQDASGAWIWSNIEYSPVVDGTKDWTKLTVTGTAPVGAQSVVGLVSPGDINGQGTYWIDAVAITETLKTASHLANPSFEEGLADWSINNGIDGTAVVDTTTVFNGKRSLKVTRASVGDQFQFEGHDYNTYIGGRTFTISAYIKTLGITGQGVHLRTYWQDAAGSCIWENIGHSSSIDGTKDWTKLTATSTAPAAAQRMVVLVSPGDTNGQGTYWIDSVEVAETQKGSNYLTNPSFETGVSGWSINNGKDGASAIDTASAINGRQSLKVTRASAGDQFQYAGYNSGTYMGGRTFTASAYIKTSGITGQGVHLRMYWQDVSGLWIWNNVEYSPFVDGTRDWTKLTVTGIAPPNAQSVVALVSPGDMNGQGTYWIDSVEITELQPSNYLMNSGFEAGIQDWSINNGTDGKSFIDSTAVFEGKQSLQVIRSSSGDQFQYESCNFGTFIGGKTLVATAYVKTSGITGKGIHLRMYWQDETGAWIWNNIAYSPSVEGTKDWTKLAVSGIAPAAAQRAIVLISPGDINGQGTYWIDFISLSES
ncbi:hypothetical protein [Paenibacillus elgii]|uniref:hypothetical protein n=1 Tax=Paenibacillus elgii TaxID=189691 RepID=UPI000FD79BA6|nr:hypothetical protein [Paenibacillus elgii]NEN86183.1 hypothetical protein [Paenibacillus elgii]